MTGHRIAIVGSRDFSPLARVTAFVEKLATKYPDAVVISGGARGVDTVAITAATRFGLGWVEFRVAEDLPSTLAANAHRRADAQCHFSHRLVYSGRAGEGVGELQINEWEAWCDADYMTFANAAFTRNEMIVKAATQVVAFWDGKSRGTQGTMRDAKRLHRPLHTFTP